MTEFFRYLRLVLAGRERDASPIQIGRERSHRFAVFYQNFGATFIVAASSDRGDCMVRFFDFVLFFV